MNHAVIITILVLPAVASVGSAQTTRPALRIALAGDSTVADTSGWGAGFAARLRDDVQCLNFAQGGRSTKSFRDEGHWAKVLAAKPDHVLIQFGHNDQPGKGRERETDAATTYRDNLRAMIDEARAAGIKPVLVTPLERRRWTEWHTIRPTLEAYAEAVRRVAAERKVPLIDLHAKSIDVYESLGPDGCGLIEPPDDRTHLNAAGGAMFGSRVEDELRRVVPELERYRRPYSPPTTRPVAATAPAASRPATAVAATQAASRGARTITVAADGNGDYRTVQEAIAAAPDNNSDRTTIRIRPGKYFGQIVVPRHKPNISFIGDHHLTTSLTYALNVQDPIPPNVLRGMNGIGVVVLGDGFRAENITFSNTSGDHGQALALRLQGDRAVLRDCNLLGWQDTLRSQAGRHYFRDCYIDGRVDFIYGAGTAVFDGCIVHSKNGGYITAASTPENQPFGFVFLDCRLTGDGDKAYLGRPWRPFAAVAFIRCQMGDHIRPEGWHNWGKVENEKTARYAEYQCTGPGANRAGRVPWSRELRDSEAKQYTIRNILGGADDWDPTAE